MHIGTGQKCFAASSGHTFMIDSLKEMAYIFVLPNIRDIANRFFIMNTNFNVIVT